MIMKNKKFKEQQWHAICALCDWIGYIGNFEMCTRCGRWSVYEIEDYMVRFK